MAVCSRRVARARPVRRFRVPDLETQPPIVGPLHAVSGQHAVQAGKLHGRRVGVHLRRDRRRAQQVTGECRQIRDRRGRAETGRLCAAVQPGRRHAQRFAHRLGQVATELDARLPLHGLGQHGKAVVRIDPAGAGLGQHVLGVHRQTRRMRQQVADRGAGRAGRGVEVDDPFLDGDVHGPGHQRLGHRRQREHPLGVAVGWPARRAVRSPRRRRPRPASRRARRGRPSGRARHFSGDVVVVDRVRLDLGHPHVVEPGVGQHRRGQLGPHAAPSPAPSSASDTVMQCISEVV